MPGFFFHMKKYVFQFFNDFFSVSINMGHYATLWEEEFQSLTPPTNRYILKFKNLNFEKFEKVKIQHCGQ